MSDLAAITSQLGYFLDYRQWESAIQLLDYQLSLKPMNKHYNTLSMFYYENLSHSDKVRVHDKEYFDKKVANNLLYGLEREFAIHSYPIPKASLGLRKYRFLTYPMRIAYYSLGLYLLQLSQEFTRQYYSSHKHIHSYYGGALSIDEKSRAFQLRYESVWYKPHYQEFRKRVRRAVEGDTKNMIVIHMDIQNYFEEIGIPTLMGFLSDYIKPSIQKELRFDPITKGQITDFFGFMANGRSGIPQTDNDVISSFIGHLFLIFGDLLIDDEIQLNRSGVIKEYSIIRFVDDIYILLTFEGISLAQKEVYISALASQIADCLYQKLGLRLNTKTKLYWMSKQSDIDDLLKGLKRVSPGYDLSDEENKDAPLVKVDLILNELRNLKKSPLEPTFNSRGDLNAEILKEVYDKGVSQLFARKDIARRIRQVFKDFNFDLVIAQPKEIMIILLTDSSAAQRFKSFLLSKRNLTSRDVHLVLTYLCQTDFESNELIELLRSTETMSGIFEIFSAASVPLSDSGYYSLSVNQILQIAGFPNVIEQIRLRVQAERKGEYSVALNHLLNEIHAICYRLDNRSINEKDYDVAKVAEFLAQKRVSHITCIKVRNLFDRRNKNPVSHADPIAWPVSRDEYLDYHGHVGVCLKSLL
jgi:AbiA family abortive infection protein